MKVVGVEKSLWLFPFDAETLSENSEAPLSGKFVRFLPISVLDPRNLNRSFSIPRWTLLPFYRRSQVFWNPSGEFLVQWSLFAGHKSAPPFFSYRSLQDKAGTEKEEEEERSMQAKGGRLQKRERERKKKKFPKKGRKKFDTPISKFFVRILPLEGITALRKILSEEIF